MQWSNWKEFKVQTQELSRTVQINENRFHFTASLQYTQQQKSEVYTVSRSSYIKIITHEKKIYSWEFTCLGREFTCLRSTVIKTHSMYLISPREAPLLYTLISQHFLLFHDASYLTAVCTELNYCICQLLGQPPAVSTKKVR